MIIKGGAAGNVRWWAQHLQRDDTNERAAVKEITGLLATDLTTALREMQAIAGQSRSGGNFMYQANINPETPERLTEAQWTQAIDTLEDKLGMKGHQRVVVEHEKEGRTHRHVIWNRVDVETLRVTDIGGNYYTHERVARALEQSFGLSPTPSLHGQQRPDGRPERGPELWEKRAAERSGIDPKAITAELTQLWRSADGGAAFVAALEQRGYVLAQGSRRDFCIVDHAGDAHSLARRIEGVKAKDVRERLDSINKDALPTVEEARAAQREKHPTHEAARVAWQGRDRGRDPQPSPQPHSASHQATNARPDSQADRAPPLDPWRAASRGWDDARPADRAGQRAQSAERVQESWRMARDAEVARVTDAGRPAPAKGGLRVGGGLGAVGMGLADFAAGLLAGGGKPPPTPEEKKHMNQVAEIKAQRRALAALESIRDSMAKGQDLKPEDVSHLTHTHLENIRQRGDAYMRQLIERMEADRAREQDYGRTRER